MKVFKQESIILGMVDTATIDDLKSRISRARWEKSVGNHDGDIFSLETMLAEEYTGRNMILEAASVYRNIGWEYEQQGDCMSAVENYLSAVRAGKPVFRREEMLWLHFHLLSCAANDEKQVPLLLNLAQAYTELHLRVEAAGIYRTIGETLMSQNEYGPALRYFTLASDMAGDVFDKDERLRVYTDMKECTARLSLVS